MRAAGGATAGTTASPDPWTTRTAAPTATTWPRSMGTRVPEGMRAPPTVVPLVLPRSSTWMGRPPWKEACSRETEGWSMVMSHVRDRPTVMRPVSGSSLAMVPPGHMATTCGRPGLRNACFWVPVSSSSRGRMLGSANATQKTRRYLQSRPKAQRVQQNVVGTVGVAPPSGATALGWHAPPSTPASRIVLSASADTTRPVQPTGTKNGPPVGKLQVLSKEPTGRGTVEGAGGGYEHAAPCGAPQLHDEQLRSSSRPP